MELSPQTRNLLMLAIGNDPYGIPHGGWKYRQPQLNWEMPHPGSENIFKCASRLSEVRKRNIRFGFSPDPDDCAKDIVIYWLTAHKRPIPDLDPKKAKAPPPVQPPNAGAADVAVGAKRNLVAGAKALLEWLGKETPVAQAEADRRAAICAICPKNVKGDFWDRLIGEVADTARHWMGLRKSMALATSKDSELHLCDACGCPLTTKVWVHLDHIRKHTEAEVFKELDPGCWITKP